WRLQTAETESVISTGLGPWDKKQGLSTLAKSTSKGPIVQRTQVSSKGPRGCPKDLSSKGPKASPKDPSSKAIKCHPKSSKELQMCPKGQAKSLITSFIVEEKFIACCEAFNHGIWM
ncbi:hypothetical protein CR513_62755, partial [Mucuna pruriens]